MASPIQDAFLLQKKNQASVRRSTAEERIQKLRKLKQAIQDRVPALHAAIYADYRKSAAEVDISEVYATLVEIDFAIKHLAQWMRPVTVSNTMLMRGHRSQIYYEPKGTVLVIGPWNYPFTLVISPLISALAAGNTVMLKPSELTQNTSRLLKEMISSLFDPSEVALFEGGTEVAQELLTLPFDHIFFTGSTRVGRIVMEAAAKNLTPVTLELGGKSPAIIDETADLKAAAERIVWGKFFNAGQTCVAPDYILVPTRLQAEFLQEARGVIAKFYGATAAEQRATRDYCRIISDAHYQRLKKMVQDALAQGAKAETGAEFDDGERYIAPTLITGIKPDARLLKEEIFGPVLPILSYDSLDAACESIAASGEKPLALYIFSKDSRRIEQVLHQTTAGGTCVNATLIHLGNPNLPFGGIGGSGIGSYHGHFGFKTFSHERAVLRQGPIDGLKLLYPPFTKRVTDLIALAIKYVR